MARAIALFSGGLDSILAVRLLTQQDVEILAVSFVTPFFGSGRAERAAADAVQVHGAYGCSDEYPVERFYRNAKSSSIYEGTREVQTLMQADYVLGIRVDKPRPVELPTADQTQPF